ncbi:hypothetical protein ATG_00650 [Desulfurococcaceae archaeon AG1]|jgi:large subunit ribosomal protein L13|nr:MAG: 50S ribosomal protein L13 [Desulfurococcaceae archaeon]GAY24862.1 hypothetical protein ATG_00650 [Desulfurococcaceae archaeon AG1]
MSTLRSVLEEISRTAGSGKTVVIDAENAILGRMCTIIAKLLLDGYRVYVINAEKAVVSGERRRVVEGYKLLLKVRTHRNPYRSGIRRPRTPINIIKRTVRGMLPKECTRGMEALKRLKVYIGIPEELSKLPRVKLEIADASRLGGRYVYLGDIARELGWKG